MQINAVIGQIMAVYLGTMAILDMLQMGVDVEEMNDDWPETADDTDILDAAQRAHYDESPDDFEKCRGIVAGYESYGGPEGGYRADESTMSDYYFQITMIMLAVLGVGDIIGKSEAVQSRLPEASIESVTLKSCCPRSRAHEVLQEV